MPVYYNENDPKCVAWLRELLRAGVLPDGEIDDRSILDVCPDDLRGFTQCHFFAGIGGWAYALQLAAWPDDREIWTGSCPCQPFSTAGKGAGFADERHLWPAFFWLTAERRPAVLMGEQVASPAGLIWFDLVSTDLEGIDYAVGAVDLPAAGVGAPHIRQRLWFVAESGRERCKGQRLRLRERRSQSAVSQAAGGGEAGRMADAEHAERRALNLDQHNERDGADGGWQEAYSEPRTRREVCDSADAERSKISMGDTDDPRLQGRLGAVLSERAGECAVGQTSDAGFWANVEWIACRDGKYRPVEPGTFPLAHGVPARVGRLRGYGNAIVPQVAAEVIRAYRERDDE